MKLIDISTPKFPSTFAMVDDEDFDWLNQWKWTAQYYGKGKHIYAVRVKYENGSRKILAMHREVARTPKGLETDHWDRNTLNNQKNNLRNADKSQNGSNQKIRSTNTSGYPGVYWLEDRKKWQVQITARNKKNTIGYYLDKEDAIRSKKEAEAKFHGQFARSCEAMNA